MQGAKKIIIEVVTTFSQLLAKNIMTQRFSMHNPIWPRDGRHSFMAREVWKKNYYGFEGGLSPCARRHFICPYSVHHKCVHSLICGAHSHLWCSGSVRVRKNGRIYALEIFTFLLPLLPFANKYPILKWHNFTRASQVYTHTYIRFMAQRCGRHCRHGCCSGSTLVRVQTQKYWNRH